LRHIDDRLSLPQSYGAPELTPDLAAVVAAWPELPEALKAGIVAMVKAALGGRPSDRSWKLCLGGGLRDVDV